MNIREAMLNAGWGALDSKTSPLAYRDSSGKAFGTIYKAGVILSLSLGVELIEDRSGVMIFYSDDKTSILNAIIVDAEFRRKGLAQSAIAQLTYLADATRTKLFLEPVPIQDKCFAREPLIEFYSKFNFAFHNKDHLVMSRDPFIA
jgi:GNAT superfamily N-acetyltransferase